MLEHSKYVRQNPADAAIDGGVRQLFGSAARRIEECGGLERIEQLLSHDFQLIAQMASEIVDKYFTDEAL